MIGHCGEFVKRQNRTIETVRQGNFGIMRCKGHCTRDRRIGRGFFTSKRLTA